MTLKRGYGWNGICTSGAVSHETATQQPQPVPQPFLAARKLGKDQNAALKCL